MELNDVRYPLGRYQAPATITARHRERWLNEIEALPDELQTAVFRLDEKQLDTPYRPDGWTVRQIVHHLPDSHLNSYVRFRLALTEEQPTIKPYEEARWAELPDAKTAPIDLSLGLLNTLHLRWVFLLRSLDTDQFARTFHHPGVGAVRLDWSLGLYAWHGRHHVAQITQLRTRLQW